MIRRLVREEAGVAMGLAIITMVLIGVMGAGLLTFVVTDLTAVVEVNQGQRAFEVADAGVQAAKRQLASDSTSTRYDGTSGDNLRWASSYPGGGGVTLNNLDSVDTTTDSVTVTIAYEPSQKHFKVISTGTAGEARRRIEATFAADETGYSGIKGYYTPGDVRIDKGTEINGMSIFSSRNIQLVDYDWNYYGRTPASDSRINVKTNSTKDPYGDWNTSDDSPPANWNTTPRRDTSGNSFEFPGFAAEGLICNSTSCSSTSDSFADGYHGYDSTTGTEGTRNKFVRKTPADAAQPQNTISYPFNVNNARPNVEALITEATSQAKYIDTSGDDYGDWNAIYNNSSSQTVVFVDGRRNNTGVSVKVDATSRVAQGVLVGYCIDLTIDAPTDFKGVIILLKDSSCADKGLYKSNDATVRGFVYAEGDNLSTQGVYATSKSKILSLPEGLQLNSVVSSGSIQLQSWRELYQ